MLSSVKFVSLLFVLLAQAISIAQDGDNIRSFTENLPARNPVTMREVRILTRATKSVEEENQVQGNSQPGKENSGIVKSRSRDDLYWVHNDSGDEPKIYSIHADGSDYVQSRYAGDLGVTVAGAINVDWEDISADASSLLCPISRPNIVPSS